MDTNERHAEATNKGHAIDAQVGTVNAWQAAKGRSGKAPTYRQNTLQGRPIEGDTFSEGRAYNALVDHTNLKHKNETIRFLLIAEERGGQRHRQSKRGLGVGRHQLKRQPHEAAA
jgi:hypothetical protein